MLPHLDDVLALIEAERKKQSDVLPQFGRDKVASFMATCAAAGEVPAVAVRRTASLARAAEREELLVSLEGTLPRAPDRGECIAIAATAVEDFRGYQLKSHTLVDPAFASRLHSEGPSGAVVQAPQVFTIHHGPQTANFFEKIPLDDVLATCARARYAIVAVGEQANVSPRWILYHEVRDGALELYQGDALWSKTYLNVRRNPREARLVLDLRTGAGFALEGTQVDVRPEDHPAAAEKIAAMFAGAGIKRIARMSRLRVEAIRRIVPEA